MIQGYRIWYKIEVKEARVRITASQIHENLMGLDRDEPGNHLPHSLPYTSPQPVDNSDEGMVHMEHTWSAQDILPQDNGVLGMADTPLLVSDT